MNQLYGTIATMLKKSKASHQSFNVECSKINKEKDGVLKMIICDGEQTCKAKIQAQKAKKVFEKYLRNKEIFQLEIRGFTVCNQQIKVGFQTVLIIEDFQIVCANKVKQEYKDPVINLEEIQKTVKKEHRKPQANHLKQIKMQSIQNLPPKTTQSKPKLNLDFSSDQNEDKKTQAPSELDIRTFEKIEDLYQGLFGWQILVRVIDKSFREFLSKKNKEIQIVTLELIDRAGFMIEATCFGQQAVFLNAAVKTRGVYRIARAKIIEETYKKQKSDKHSKYTLRLQSDSSIIPVRDFSEIPYNSNNYVRLSQITYDIDTSQFYNFVGVLAKIEPQKTIVKLDRDIIMQNFKIGDPITDLVVEGIIWNRQVNLKPQFLNRSVLLKNFKVSNYKDTMNLSATFKSQIILHDLFVDREDRWKSEKIVEDRTEKNTKKLCDLATDLKHLQRQTILSDINVYVKAICLSSKWYYDSCPKCKKGSTPFNICLNCSYRVQQCLKRFLLTVELCDDTGSIFVTAFDDTATIFLNNATMQQLQNMDDTQRKSYADKCTFQAYEMKISSKKDGNGRINHNIIGRPELVDAKVQAQLNLKKIQKQLRQLNPYNYLQ